MLVAVAITVVTRTATTPTHAKLQPWDAGLQSPSWQQRQQRELRELSAASLSQATAGPLEPCPRPPQPVALPDELPAAVRTLINDTEKSLDALFAKSQVTGGVGVLVYGDRVLLTRGYGSTRRGSGGRAVDGKTVFRVGSISKVFTDLMLMQRHEAGTISMDDPITKFAPAYSPKWPRGKKPTPRAGTLRDLGSHMAGLERYMPCTFGVDCNISLETALRRISEWTLIFEPGARLAYSNTGFSLLGQLLARAEGRPWEALLLELASSLGMDATRATPPEDAATLAHGYTGDTPVPIQDLGITNPAGGVYSTADDMAKLMSFLLRDGEARSGGARGERGERGEKGQPLDSATTRRWLTDQVFSNPSAFTASAQGLWYTSWGTPWQNLQANLDGVAAAANFSRFSVRSKDGSIPGFNAQLVLQPELKLGLFTAMTTGDGGRTVPFFSDSLVLGGLGVVPAMASYLSTVQPSQLPPRPADYAGTFSAALSWAHLQTPRANLSLVVGADAAGGPLGGTTLYVRSNVGLGWPADQPLAWVRDDTFVMVAEPTDLCFTIEGGENWVLRFGRGADGAVTTVTLEGFGIYPAILTRMVEGL